MCTTALSQEETQQTRMLFNHSAVGTLTALEKAQGCKRLKFLVQGVLERIALLLRNNSTLLTTPETAKESNVNYH